MLSESLYPKLTQFVSYLMFDMESVIMTKSGSIVVLANSSPLRNLEKKLTDDQFSRNVK